MLKRKRTENKIKPERKSIKPVIKNNHTKNNTEGSKKKTANRCEMHDTRFSSGGWDDQSNEWPKRHTKRVNEDVKDDRRREER